jgi:hypothetical protein
MNRLTLASLLIIAFMVPTAQARGKSDKDIYLEQISDVDHKTFTLAIEFATDRENIVRSFGSMDPTSLSVEIYFSSGRGMFRLRPVAAPEGRLRFQTADIPWTPEMNGAVMLCTESMGCLSLAEKVPTYVSGQRYYGLLEKEGQLFYYKPIEPGSQPTATQPPPSMFVSPPPPPSAHVAVPSIRP